MNSDLAGILREIGTITVPSKKGEISFEIVDEDLVVIYKEHKPDGSYTDEITWIFELL